MPFLLSKRISESSAYAIWNITETKDELEQLVSETPNSTHPNKISEWIVTRILVRHLTEQFGIKYQGITKTESGKPLLNGSKAEISITHSFPLAAAIINLHAPTGIDLEWPRSKLIDVQHKFLHTSELAHKNDINALCKIWMCKEVLFKIYGRKSLSFKDEIQVDLRNNKATGLLIKHSDNRTYDLRIEEVYYNHLLAYST
ncbi:MAG: hypothetical protein JXQ90_17050 [Cyclobacteriaceae bacterium]